MGSPVSPSLREATTCLMYSTYLFTVRADRDFDFFILSTTGLTVMLLTLPNGMSPMAGSIHLWRAALILAGVRQIYRWKTGRISASGALFPEFFPTATVLGTKQG